MMAFGSLSLSKFRSRKDKVGGKDKDKAENRNTPNASTSQSTMPPLPTAVGAGQKQTIVSAQAHPRRVDEARDELTKSLRGKYPAIMVLRKELLEIQSLIFYRGSIFPSA